MNTHIFDNPTGALVSGVVIALVPFLGFPAGFEDFLLIVGGAFVAVFSYRIRAAQSPKEMPLKTSEVFSESVPEQTKVPNNKVGSEMRSPQNENTA